MENVVRKDTVKKKVATGCVWGVAVVLLFQMSNPSFILWLLLFVAMFLSGTCSVRQISLVDVIVGMLWLYEGLQCLYTMNEVTTVSVFRFSTLMLMAYVVLRKVLENVRCYALFLQAILVLGSVAVIIALLSFGVFYRSATDAGFTETYSLRFLFRPLGYNTNAWVTVLFALMGCTLLVLPSKNAGKNLRLSLWGLLWVALQLSFSRAAFIVLGLCFLSLFLLKDVWTEKLKLITVALVSMGVTTVCFPKETIATLQMNHTASQQRSTQGRINSVHAAWKVFGERKMLGTGAGTYIQCIDKEHFQDSNQSYSSYPPNWVMWALVEKGIVGGVLYGILILSVCITVWKGRRKRNSLYAGSILALLLLKEMSLWTTVTTPMTAFMFCALLALLQTDNSVKVFPLAKVNIPMHYFLGLCLMVCLCTHYYFHRFDENRKIMEQAFVAFEKGHQEEAVGFIEELENEMPWLINKGRFYMKCGQYREAKETLAKAMELQPEDVYVRFMYACTLLPTEKKEKGLCELERLVGRYPENALFRYEWFRQLYQGGYKEKAMEALEYAIRTKPRILLMGQTEQLKETDSLFYQSLVNRLIQFPSKEELTTSEKARQGFILYHCGKQVEAVALLEEAVKELPNMSTPWLLLGKYQESIGNIEYAEACKKKHRLLAYGAFVSKEHGWKEPVWEVPKETDLWKIYAMKSQSWYGCKLIF